MNMHPLNVWSEAVLSWLQNILNERFGDDFVLQAESQGSIKLTRTGDSYAIDIISDPETFSRTDSGLDFTTWDAANEDWTSALNKCLPAPGAKSLPFPLIEQTKSGYRVNYDILGLTYWMLSRSEEVSRTDLDIHGRFPATSSHAFKHDYLDRPVVDEWLYILRQLIQRTWPDSQIKQNHFSIKVSHDVDGPSRYGFRSSTGIIRAMASDIVKRRDLKYVAFAPWIHLTSRKKLHPKDPANTFDWIMDISERHQLKSAFYFICGRTDPNKDAVYEIEHPAMRKLMRSMHARGHEIGLHPSYGTYQSPLKIASEASRLRSVCQEENIQQDCWGGRMHYLRWEHPKTMYGWENAHMDYDSTLSYADRPGFRCGTCFEYPAFDPVENKELRLRIRPLIAMECTVIAMRYLGLGTSDAALKKFLDLKNNCKAVGGCFTLLWHNTEFHNAAHRALYQAVLTDA